MSDEDQSLLGICCDQLTTQWHKIRHLPHKVNMTFSQVYNQIPE